MAVVVQVTLHGVTKAEYGRVRAETGWTEDAPAGGFAHIAWWEGEDCIVVDAWESEEAFGVFAETRLGPGMARAGVTAQPETAFHAAHEVFAPAAITLA